METKEIIILSAALAFASFRLYQKYIKNKSNQPDNKSEKAGKEGSFTKDDDYEPYSGR